MKPTSEVRKAPSLSCLRCRRVTQSSNPRLIARLEERTSLEIRSVSEDTEETNTRYFAESSLESGKQPRKAEWPLPTGGSIGKVWFFSKHFSKPLGNSQHPWLAAAPVLRAALAITCRLLLGLLATQCGHPLPASGDMTLNTQKDPCHWRQQGSTTFPLRPDPFPTPPCHTLCSPSDCAYPASYACSQDLIPNP